MAEGRKRETWEAGKGRAKETESGGEGKGREAGGMREERIREAGRGKEKKDVKKVLVIGSGPIVIGQSAEFDYSGTQACRALREEGIEVVLINSNPATIQTDSEIADRIYIEPITAEVAEKIIGKEKPDALLATVGGQTGLNTSMELYRKGVLKKHGVEFLGTDAEAIDAAESREEFNKLMRELGIGILPGKVVKEARDAVEFANEIGYPVIVRPSFTLGGTGGGTVYNDGDLKKVLEGALRLSATGEALIEKSALGWGEFEYEVVRDAYGNAAIICNMENVDPMGIHTGESIVAVPSQTLSDADHQRLRDAALAIVHAVGIKGSCNVQFSVNQETGEFTVIEVNPRLSRSSALASKAAGYPIARVATKIALGHSLYEIRNAITGTSAAFEPALDYVVTKIPRWPFDKFPNTPREIGTQMKSTGEVMAIGRTFQESLNKAIRSLEVRVPRKIKVDKHLYPATDLRVFALFEAFREGRGVAEIQKITKINKWFLERIAEMVELEKEIAKCRGEIGKELMFEAKRFGHSDSQIAKLAGCGELEIRKLRKKYGILPTYKIVDSCAGEFEAITPYFYSTYEKENEAVGMEGKKIIVIGAGPIRIGQGIEFDYCCSHAAFAIREMGCKSIMINNNPETVSTDFDSSDRLYFEPLTFEDVLNVIENEKPFGVIVQLGGQTSINLAGRLSEAGVNILGTSVDNIDVAEDRDRFRELAHRLGIAQPENGIAMGEEEAVEVAGRIGYPVVVRPSYVIAGRAMEIVRNEADLRKYVHEAVEVSEKKPVLIDKYLDNAIECEVDAASDGENVFISGIMEHIEPAGVHSGDANIVVPSLRLSEADKETIIAHTKKLGEALGIVGLMNIQYVVKKGVVYILEVNPRASRTVPYVSKAIGVPIAKLAVKAMCGEKLPAGLEGRMDHYAVKSIVFPFLKLLGTDIRLGPEMRSTGETMGLGKSFEMAYYKALLAAGVRVEEGERSAFLSFRDEDKGRVPELAALLGKLGFRIYGTQGTVGEIGGAVSIPKIGRGHPDIVDLIAEGKIGLVINTPRRGGQSHTDGFKMRSESIRKGIPCITNVNTAFELLKAIDILQKRELDIRAVDEYAN